MRRSLIITVTASVSVVLIAMLVPMGILLRSYALEDRLSRAALEVKATEAVVVAQDKGALSVYLDRINSSGNGTQTSVLFPATPGLPEGLTVGPDGTQSARVESVRAGGRARVDDTSGGAEILVPVTLQGTSTGASTTPVIRVTVSSPGLGASVVRGWLVVFALGIMLLLVALVLADRLGTSYVRPIRDLADHARRLAGPTAPDPLSPRGPPEVRELTEALNRLVSRIEVLRQRERAVVADLSHRLRTPVTALRLRVDGLDDAESRDRLGADLDDLEAMVDHVVREARRSEREGMVASTDGVVALVERVRFWEPLAQDQGRTFVLDIAARGPVAVRASRGDLEALVDVLMDNVFTYTPDGSAISVSVAARAGGGLVLSVADQGPGFPADLDVTGRGTSGSGSTGLGLAIARQTATESGGGLSWTSSQAGGAVVEVDLGPG